MGQRTFTYKAFISYNSRDGHFAEKLEEWLIKLSNYMDAEKKYKFFRDCSYANVGENVEEKLKQGLEESEWLILVCSPFVNDYKAGERNWVDFECSYYADILGRKDNIVGIISNSAPLDRNISCFYPESVRDLHKKLAADMRGDKEWGRESSRVYAGITGRNFTDVYDIAQNFYWERIYCDTISEAYKKSKEGDCEKALQILSQIPDKYNPEKIEWRFLKALCSKSMYENYCGRLDRSAGNQIICYDKKLSYAYSTDNDLLYVINCLKAEVVTATTAHDGNKFRFMYIGEGYFVTFDEDITVKLWRCEGEKITLISQTTMEIQFTKAESAVFKSFYPDCKIDNMPVAYHSKAHLFALSVRNNLFVLNVETMKYEKINIPTCRKNIAQLACVWKRIVISDNAEMIFLADEWYLLGWDLGSGERTFFWNRKECRPQYAYYSENNIFEIDNTPYSIYIYDNGHKAEWREGHVVIAHFDLAPGKRLNSVHMVNISTEYIVLLYEDTTVQVLKSCMELVYSENVPIKNMAPTLNFPEAYCPATIYKGELWHSAFYQVRETVCTKEKKYIGKSASYKGMTAAIGKDKRTIAVFDEDGHLLRETEICSKKQEKLLSDKELDLPPGTGASELLKKYISQYRDQDFYECSAYTFVDSRRLLIGCTKGHLYQWIPDENLLTRLDKIHKMDITSIQVYRQWSTVLTVDREGVIAVWKYETEDNGNVLNYISSFPTYKSQIMTQLVTEDEIAVFCNDTGELLLYTDYKEENQNIQILLSAEDARENNIYQVLSMYVTVDKSRLIVCRPRSIVFVQIPSGKILLESEMTSELKGMRIYDGEEMLGITMKNNVEESYYIANLTEKKYNMLLKDRREKFFCRV